MEQTNKTNSDAVVALVFGIISVVFAFLGLWLNIVGLICAIIALIFAIKARKQVERKGMSTAGLVLGIIGCSLCPIFLACNICVYSAAKEVKNGINSWAEELNETLNNKETQEKLNDVFEKIEEKANELNDHINSEEFNEQMNELEENLNNLLNEAENNLKDLTNN